MKTQKLLELCSILLSFLNMAPNGAMLWNLYGDKAEQMFRCWRTCAKLCLDVPRGTHTYLVNNLLAVNFQPLRNQALSRYITFYRSLLSSPSKEVAVVARIVGRNAGTTTGLNLLNLRLETKLNPWTSSVKSYKDYFCEIEVAPEMERWRLPLLKKYLKIRDEQTVSCQDTEYIDSLISSLCTS